MESKKTAVNHFMDGLIEKKLILNSVENGYILGNLFQESLELEKKDKLKYQLFIGRISEIIGFKETFDLFTECSEIINKK